jgi:hypothetical protein
MSSPAASRTIFHSLFLDPRGLFGWFILLIKPIRALLEAMGDADLLFKFVPALSGFLDTGWGTAASMLGGAIIISYSVIHASKTQITNRPAAPTTAPKMSPFTYYEKPPLNPVQIERSFITPANGPVYLRSLLTKEDDPYSVLLLIMAANKALKGTDLLTVEDATVALEKSGMEFSRYSNADSLLPWGLSDLTRLGVPGKISLRLTADGDKKASALLEKYLKEAVLWRKRRK